MAEATARHILVNNEQFCEELKAKIIDGAGFGDVAREHSTCPSSQSGGDLGSFGPGRGIILQKGRVGGSILDILESIR